MLIKLIISYLVTMVKKLTEDIVDKCQKDSPRKEMTDS